MHDEIVVFEVMTESAGRRMVEELPASVGAGFPTG